MTELETMQRAKMYLDKLSRGIDPITDREMPEDAVLNNVRICRCLHYVSGVLEQVIANGGAIGEKAPFAISRERMVLYARIPVATSLDYAATLAAQTGGRGAMSIRLAGYRECPLELGTTTPRRSVDPLDTSKYILAARSALEGGIFNLE